MGVGWPGGSGGGGGTFPPTSLSIVPAWFSLGEFNFDEFATDSTETNIVAYTIPPRGVVHGVLVTPITQFEGPFLTSYTVQCGIPGTPDRFTSPLDVASVVPGDDIQQMSPPLLDQISHGNATPFWITATSTGTGLDQVTAGTFRVDILISLTPSPAP